MTSVHMCVTTGVLCDSALCDDITVFCVNMIWLTFCIIMYTVLEGND